jgi:carbonic anhydrase
VDWDYHQYGPDVWPDLFPQCGGSAQTPINIATARTTYRGFSPFKLSSSYNSTQSFKLVNIGHIVSASLVAGASSPPSFTGGGLRGTYQFVDLHLHWGENYRSSSEHQV